MPLLLRDVGPCLVKFDLANILAAHQRVMKDGAAFPDAEAKAHDRVAVDAGQTLYGAD